MDEVCRIRGFQEHLAVERPEDPLRVFGEAVEAATSSGTVAEQLARVCTDIVAQALPAVIDKLTTHIDERLAHLESRQRVNLNVRAPKRSSPQNPPIARDITGVPFPVARFLDEKEQPQLAGSAEELRADIQHASPSAQEEEAQGRGRTSSLRGAKSSRAAAIHRGRPGGHAGGVGADGSASRGFSGAAMYPAGSSRAAGSTERDGHAET